MNTLKQLSISLVLLSCLAITNKACAMNLQFDQEAREEREERLKTVKYVARASRTGVMEQDIQWICHAIAGKRLSVPALKILIKSGLDKYVNEKTYNPFTSSKDATILEQAIMPSSYSINPDIDALEIIRLLVSIGAKIDNNVLKQTEIADPRVLPLMLAEKERLEKGELEIRMEEVRSEEIRREPARNARFVGKNKIEDKFEQTMCTICQEEFTNETENLFKLPCGHIFNEDCIAQSLLSKDDKNNLYKNQCPNCREALTEDFVEKYFLSLLAKKHDDLEFKQQLLFYAATKASVNILAELFKEGTGVRVDTNAKTDAIKYYDGSVNDMGELIEIQETDWTPLHFAANQSNKNTDNEAKRLETIRLLVTNGANVNSQNSRRLKPENLIINKESRAYRLLVEPRGL
jgi:RING-finger-containing ubiquitin ligase